MPTSPPDGPDDPVDPRDPHASAARLVEARTRLLTAARRVRRSWMLLAALAFVPVLLTALGFAVSLFTHPGFALMWSVLLVGATLNLVRFWPRESDGRGVALGDDEVRRLRIALDPHSPTWVSGVNLVPEPTVSVDGRRLSLGMPLLATLGAEDLRRLVLIAVRAAVVVDDDTAVRRAFALADGGIGRPLLSWMPSFEWAHGPRARFRADLGRFLLEKDRWAAAFRANAELSSSGDAEAMQHQDQVIEGWNLMRREWIKPSLDRGCWHRAPFSSLQQFLAGAQEVGLLERRLPPRPVRGPLVDLVLEHEDEVGDVMLGERRSDDLRIIDWDEHPAMVTVPTWRSVVGEALDVSRRLSGRSTAPTVAGVIELIESGRLAGVAQHIAPNHGIDQTSVGWAVMSRWIGGYSTLLLTAVVGMAAIDSGRFRADWRWPDGTTLLSDQGWILPLHRIADEVLWPKGGRTTPALEELREALGELGIDVTEPLWLSRDEVRAHVPERPKGSFVAYQGLASRQAIVTDKALHVFGRPWSSGWRDHYAARMRGADELRTRMLRVWQGDEADQTAYIPGSEVDEARFSLLTGGSRWRLTLQGEGTRFVLRGFGDGRTEEGIVAGWLGDRLTTTWLHASPRVLHARNLVGRIGSTLGGLALAAALVVAVWSPFGTTGGLALALSVAGVAALVAAVLPDVALELVWKVRGPSPRPAVPVIERRFARPALSAEPTAEVAREGARGSAMEAITLDLGDLPSLAQWPAADPALSAVAARELDVAAFAHMDELSLEDLGIDLDALEEIDETDGLAEVTPLEARRDVGLG